MMIDLDHGVARLDYSVSYPYPASAVFAAITDFPAYPWWQPDVMGIRAAEALPAGLGTQVLEVDNVMGRPDPRHPHRHRIRAGPPGHTADPG